MSEWISVKDRLPEYGESVIEGGSPMSRKRFIKKLMAQKIDRNSAERMAAARPQNSSYEQWLITIQPFIAKKNLAATLDKLKEAFVRIWQCAFPNAEEGLNE